MKYSYLILAFCLFAQLEANIVILERSSVFSFEHVETEGVEYLYFNEDYQMEGEDEDGRVEESYSSERFSEEEGLESVDLIRKYDFSVENGGFGISTDFFISGSGSEIILSQEDSIRFMGNGSLSLSGFTFGGGLTTRWKLWNLTDNELVREYNSEGEEGGGLQVYSAEYLQNLSFEENPYSVEMLFELETRYEGGVPGEVTIRGHSFGINEPRAVPEASTLVYSLSFLFSFMVGSGFVVWIWLNEIDNRTKIGAIEAFVDANGFGVG